MDPLAWLAGTVEIWVAVLGLLLGGALSYWRGRLTGFNEGVAHGRISQGAVNEIAEEFDYVLEEPGVIMVDGEEFFKAIMRAQVKTEAKRTEGE